MPVIETGVGNYVYVDAEADLEQAVAIVLNAKTQRTSVCNAAESLLVHRDVADEFLARGGPRAGGRGHRARRRDVRGVRRGGPRHRRGLRPGVPRSTSPRPSSPTSAPRWSTSAATRPAHVTRSSPGRSRPPAGSSPRSTRRRCSSTPRPGSPTAESSASAPRSASRPSAARPGTDGAAGDDLHEVRGHRRWTRPLTSSHRCLGRPRPGTPRHTGQRRHLVRTVASVVVAGARSAGTACRCCWWRWLYWAGDLDGVVARVLHCESRVGAVLDILADRTCAAASTWAWSGTTRTWSGRCWCTSSSSWWSTRTCPWRSCPGRCAAPTTSTSSTGRCGCGTGPSPARRPTPRCSR